MNYFMFLDVRSNRTDYITTRIERVHQEFRSTTVDAIIYLHRDGNTIGEAEMCNEVSLTAGH